MKPFCIATIASVLGIITGLYLKSIVLFVLILVPIIVCYIYFKNYRKYIMVFLICFILFFTYILVKEKKYVEVIEKFENQEIEIQGIIVSNVQEKEYKNVYEIQVIQTKNLITGEESTGKFKLLLNIKKSKENKIFDYGDKIEFIGTYQAPNVARNYKGFDYRQFLKIKNISGIITNTGQQIYVISKDNNGFFKTWINNLKKYLIKNINDLLPQKEAGLCTALILGQKDNLEQEVQDSFRNSSLSHILAISGAHISYILLAITNLLKHMNIHKRWSKILVIIFLIFFINLVGFSPSVTRACIMAILNLLADIFFLKSDVYQNLAISSFIILLVNPYSLLDIGFQLSYGGTIGIILFAKRLANVKLKVKTLDIVRLSNLKHDITDKYDKTNKRVISDFIFKIINYIKQMAIVAISANIMIFPIIAYHFNTISCTFLISNILISPVFTISLILGFVFVVVVGIFKPIAKFISFFLSPILKLLIYISDISSKLPLSKILIPTPAIWKILLYYILIIAIARFLHGSNNRKTINLICNKIKKIRAMIKENMIIINKPKNRVIIIVVIVVMIFISFLPILKISLDDKFEIHFIDVGQGDSTLIITKTNKKILIDGGGSEKGDFDVGEKTLLPYLLDKGITKIDYLLFTHFDSDHCDGLFTILENLKVKNVIISKQGEKSNNFDKFLKVIDEDKTKILIVEDGDTIDIDKYSKIRIISPSNKLINSNVLNNNSVVAKFCYTDRLSILLTGDIEEIAEKQILERYKNTDILMSTILKVAHHGSKTSSTEEFLEAVQPKIALIGVGEKNTFGHPNQITIDKLMKQKTKIYRTDLNGEITIRIRNKRIVVNTQIKDNKK